jgi:diguanylate cyclase (GGDEF)-like protein
MPRDEPVVPPSGNHKPRRVGPLEPTDGRRATELVRQTVLTDLARNALSGFQQRPLLDKAARLVQGALDAESCGIYEYLPGGHEVLLRAAASAPGQHRRRTTLDLVTAVQTGTGPNGSGPVVVELVVPIGGTSASFGFLVARRELGGFDGEDRHFAIQVADILGAALKRLRNDEGQRRAALQDPLTGLPNRALILDHLRLALARSERQPSTVGVLFVDLNRFKMINDTLGHQAGDAVLVATAERLRSALRPPDTVGRLGGDEFVVVCEDIGGRSDALAVAARLVASLEAPVKVAGRDVRIRASIGVAVSTTGATDAAALLTEADGAMFWAKRRGRGVAVFDEGMRAGIEEFQPSQARPPVIDRFNVIGKIPDTTKSPGEGLVARLVGLLEDIQTPTRLPADR